MNYRKITAIIHPLKLEAVENQLKQLDVPGISISKVQGYGEAPNFFNSEWVSPNARIEIFIEEGKAQRIAQAIIDAAHTGNQSDGIVAILPVEALFRVRTKELLDDS
ncbi:MAG TPA: P-II family nitrogen regulator [Gammaproteobacteria bacterium]